MKDLPAIVIILAMALYAVGRNAQEARSATETMQTVEYIQDNVSSLSVAPGGLGGKANITPSMEVSAHFTDTGDVWCFQVGCQHWGVDYAGVEGTPVYTPFDMVVVMTGEYGPGPTWGQYIQGTFPDGVVFYAGHLKEMPQFQPGETLPAGTMIGLTNAYNHSHVQLGQPGDYGPCAVRGECIDMETYWASH